MSTVIITAITPQPPLQVQDGDVVTFRGWYTNSFVAIDEVTPVEGGNGLTGFFYEWACIIDSNGFPVIPALEVQPTTGSNPTAGFFGALFINGSFAQMIIGYPQATAGWQIPTIYGDVINFGQLALYNAAVQLLFAPNSFFTQDQTLLAIRQIVSATLATATSPGIARLSVAALDPADPVVLGRNDPSVGNLHGTLTTNRVPVASGTNAMTDSQITDDGTDIGIPTLGYVQAGDFGSPFAGSGSRLEVNDTFGLAKLFAGADAGAEYAGVWGQCSSGLAQIYLQTTGQSHLYGIAHETSLGDAQFDNNGTTIRIYDETQMVSQAARNSAPTDDNIFAEEICWFLDQNTGKLKARIRLDDGTYATWEGVYTPD